MVVNDHPIWTQKDIRLPRPPRMRGGSLHIFVAISDCLGDEGFPTALRVGATPVPIPNTEVKPHIGDGTAHVLRGRVARRWDLLERRPTLVGRRSFVQGLVPGGRPLFSYPLSGAQRGPVPEFKDRRKRDV